MATTTKKVLRMTFNDSLGGAASITLPEPKADLTAVQIEAVMDQIIALNVFVGTGGALISKKDIKIIGTTTDDLFDESAV
ncbi:MAG: DUF2922 domain-containing protein [Desulfitobacteriaceae bacterium]